METIVTSKPVDISTKPYNNPVSMLSKIMTYSKLLAYHQNSMPQYITIIGSHISYTHSNKCLYVTVAMSAVYRIVD